VAKKTHNEMTQEEREEEARKHVEGQDPIVPEPVEPLNEYGDNVPQSEEPKPAKKGK
jgi:hypothetical protein